MAGTPSGFELGFEGIDSREACVATAHGAADPDLAVGKAHVVQVVNTAFAIYDMAGSVQRPATRLASLFGNISGCQSSAETPEDLFDPEVVYDEKRDRWVLGALHFAASATGPTDSNYCMAVSQTGNPMGAWNVYKFPMDRSAPGEVWLDFPHLGIAEDVLLMGGRLCAATSFSCPNPDVFVEGRAWAFELLKLYSGGDALYSEHALGSVAIPPALAEFPVPMSLHGFQRGSWRLDSGHLFATLDKGSPRFGDFRIFEWTDPLGANDMASAAVVNMDAETGATAIETDMLGKSIGMAPQPTSPTPSSLVGNEPVPLDFDYRNGSAFISQNVACTPIDYRSCLRWIEIDVPSLVVIQAGALAPGADEGRIYPDLAVTRCNDLAIGYTRSSTADFPSAYFSFRERTDPAGTLESPERLLRAGDLSFGGDSFSPGFYRWGDYTGMTTDPSGAIVWYVGEYSKDIDLVDPLNLGDWGTFIVAAGPELGIGACGTACDDEIDNDDDGTIDYSADGDCSGALDDLEGKPECSDGLDNDGDALIDHGSDLGCKSAADPYERASCSDFIDNDNDGKVDHPSDPGCNGPADNDEACGLGYELGIAALAYRWRRNRVFPRNS